MINLIRIMVLDKDYVFLLISCFNFQRHDTVNVEFLLLLKGKTDLQFEPVSHICKHCLKWNLVMGSIS